MASHGGRANGHFAGASNPEWMREEPARNDSLFPSRVVAGAYEPRALSILYTLYRPYWIGLGRAPRSCRRPNGLGVAIRPRICGMLCLVPQPVWLRRCGCAGRVAPDGVQVRLSAAVQRSRLYLGSLKLTARSIGFPRRFRTTTTRSGRSRAARMTVGSAPCSPGPDRRWQCGRRLSWLQSDRRRSAGGNRKVELCPRNSYRLPLTIISSCL
jgi:hypothetical protein